MFLKNSQSSLEKSCAGVSFLIKLQTEVTLVKYFFVNFCNIFKSTLLQNISTCVCRYPFIATSNCGRVARCYTVQKVRFSPPPPPKKYYLLHWKPFKSDEKCFLFHLKSSFRSQYIQVFVMTFWSCKKNGFLRKIRLTEKFTTSQPG